jgi:hypothetical protein
MDRTPPAETVAWFQQEKGIFTGVADPPLSRPARGSQKHEQGLTTKRRIGGDASTVQEKKRKYRHQQ